MPKAELIQGIFKEELKNRFLCLVEVNGVDTLCYIPSSCRLSNFIDLTGKKVILSPVISSNSRTKYSVYALSLDDRYILLNMTQANKTIEANIHSRRFSFLGSRKHLKKEHCVKDYKSDLFIEDTNTVIEIKSILSFDKKALFPTIYSQRAIDQLIKIKQLLNNGYKVCYLFVSLSPYVQQVEINSEIHEYYNLFKKSVSNGMMVRGYSLNIKDNIPIIHSKLQIVIK